MQAAHLTLAAEEEPLKSLSEKKCWMWMRNISKEASENVFPWIKIYTIVLPLGNRCAISQCYYWCCWLICVVKLPSHQHVVKLLTCREVVDTLLSNSLKYSVFLVHLFLQQLSVGFEFCFAVKHLSIRDKDTPTVYTNRVYKVALLEIQFWETVQNGTKASTSSFQLCI